MSTRSIRRVLHVQIGRRHAGTIRPEGNGWTLTYDDAYRERPDATPLSLSMPLAEREHHHPVGPFLWGLLPDNEQVLARWGKDYHVSPRNPFSLLTHVGDDCAGAVRLTPDPPDAQSAADDGYVEWLTDDQVAERIRTLRHDPAAWHFPNRSGQFSLAGAQPKTALLRDGDRWGLPHGNLATTHILKPAVSGLADHDLNEHLCLTAARLLGLPAVISEVATIADERCIIVERYDRQGDNDSGWDRIHQEDVCQALAVPPTRKYQNDGGPSAVQIVELLHDHAHDTNAVSRFIDALLLNWILGGTDAHAKNYSLLLEGNAVNLAPLYDIASALPYPELDRNRLKLAMKVSRHYELNQIMGRHWAQFARDCNVNPDTVLARADELARLAPVALMTAAVDVNVAKLRSDLPSSLVTAVTDHARHCINVLDG